MQSTNLNRYLPHVAVATFAVLGLPALAASGVQAATGLPAVVGIAIAVALSLGLANAGAALWMRQPGSRDLVFGDLMVWGWLRRVRSERRLSEATRLLGGRLSAGDRSDVLERLAGSLESRDPYTHGHSRRVTRHAEMIALAMGLAPDEVARVRTAAAVHDVGKLFTPHDVLLKPGRLTDTEFDVIKRHAADGADMVAELGDREVTAIVLHHHERLDGSGYPSGLEAADIPLGSRIVAVADTFDAMTSTRPYRAGSSHKHAMDILAADAGIKFDTAAVAAFRAYYSRRWPVAWGALIVTVPQRLLLWAGGALQGGAATFGAVALVGSGSVIAPAATHDRSVEASMNRPAHVGAAAPARPDASRLVPHPHAAAAKQPKGSPRHGIKTESRRKARAVAPFHPQPRDTPTSPRGSKHPKPVADRQQDGRAEPPANGAPTPPAVDVPKVDVPKVKIPKVKVPNVKVPKVKIPKVQVPKVEVPKVQVPKVKVPKVKLPHLKLPGN